MLKEKILLEKNRFRKLKILLNGALAVEKKRPDDLACKFGVTGRSIYRWLEEPQEMQMYKLVKLAELLNVPEDEFQQSIKYR